MKVLLLGVLVAGSAYLCAPALAAIPQEDARVTRAYLRASQTSAQTEYAELGASVSAIESAVTRVNAQCPSGLAFTPRDTAFEEVAREAATSLFYEAATPLRPMLMRLARAIVHLRWHDRALTALVHERALEERSIAGLVLPDLCADIASWKATAYASLPTSVGRFVSRIEAVEATSTLGPREEPREHVILRLLRRFENPAERRVAARIERLEERLGNRVGAAMIAARRKLAAALGVASL